MLPIAFDDISALMTRRTLTNEFNDIDQTTLSKMGIVKPWWMSYYGQATTSSNKDEFANLGNIYFGITLKNGNQLPCDATVPAMKAKTTAIWQTAEGKSMMNDMRNLVFTTMSGGRPSPLQDWNYYTTPDNAKKYSVALSALLTSSEMIDILQAAPADATSQIMRMSSHVLYVLNSQFLPTQTTADSTNTGATASDMLSSSYAGMGTANGVTLAVMRSLQSKIAAYVAENVQFKASTTDSSYTSVAQLAVQQAETDSESDPTMKSTLDSLKAAGGTLGGLYKLLTVSAKNCFSAGCSADEWTTAVKREVPEVSSEESLLSVKRIGQYMAIGSFFMDLKELTSGEKVTPEEELETAHEAIEALAQSKGLIMDVGSKLLMPVMEKLGQSLVKLGATAAGDTVEQVAGWVAKATSTVLEGAETVATVLGVVVDVVTAVFDVIGAVKDFQSGQIVAGVSEVVGAVGAGIAIVAGVLAMVGVEVPFLAPLAIGVAIVGLFVQMFEPPPPPPPNGPQQVCQNLVTQGLASSVGPAPSPASVGGPDWWHTTAFTGVVPGYETCFEFQPTSQVKTYASYFGSALVQGPCTDEDYFVLATDCMFSGTNGDNLPYQGHFPSSPPPPPGQISLPSLLSSVAYRIWMKAFTQSAPVQWQARRSPSTFLTSLAPLPSVSVGTGTGRVLLGGSNANAPQGPSGPTTMFMYTQASSVCGEFSVPQGQDAVCQDFACNEYFNVGTCLDHGYYTLLSDNGKEVLETFTSGWGKGTQYKIWVKNALCGNIPDYTPNKYGVSF